MFIVDMAIALCCYIYVKNHTVAMATLLQVCNYNIDDYQSLCFYENSKSLSFFRLEDRFTMVYLHTTLLLWQYFYSHILTRSYSIALVSMETTKSPFSSDIG